MRFGMRRSLRAKIITWSFVPTTFILLAVALVTYAAYQRVTETLAIERDREITRLHASQLAVELSAYGQELDSLARTAGMSRGNAANQQFALKDASERLVIFDGGTVVLDGRGTVVATQPERPELLGRNWSGRAYFRQLLSAQGVAFSDILPDGPHGSEVISLAVPIYGDRGEFRGGLVGMFQLGPTAVSSFYGTIVKLRIGEEGNTYLVDGSGRVLYDRDFARIGADVEAEPAVQQVLQGEIGAIRTRDAAGQDVVAGFARVPGTSWGVVTQQSLNTLAGGFRNYGQFLLVLLLLGVLVPAVVVATGVQRITRPINELITASQEVARGNFGQTITADSGDEIEDLANQFSLMSAQLQQSYTQLEQQVVERSRALAAVNSVAATVNQALDLEQVLDDVLNEITEALQVEICAIYLLDEAKQVLTLAGQRGLDPAFVEIVRYQPLEDSFAGQVLRADSPVVVSDATHHELLQEIVAQGGDFQAVVGIPLYSSGQVQGTLFAATREMRAFSQQDIELLSAIGTQIGVAAENQRLLAQARETATVAERQRLARELHDAVTQTLFSASLIAEVLPRLWERNPEEAERRLAELRQLSRGALAEMRTLLMELRPKALLEAPMNELMRQLAEAFNGRVRVPVDLDVVCTGGDPPVEVKVSFYRIAQEALNNVAKHASATEVSVSLHCTRQGMEMAIRDDGVGFETGNITGDHLGLSIMEERAAAIGADLAIRTEPGQGTEVTVSWKPAVPAEVEGPEAVAVAP